LSVLYQPRPYWILFDQSDFFNKFQPREYESDVQFAPTVTVLGMILKVCQIWRLSVRGTQRGYNN